MSIRVFGDSHAAKFKLWGEPYIVTAAHASTAHNLCEPKSRYNSRDLLLDMLPEVDKDKDAILLALGEVDCRIHFYRLHVETKTSMAVLMKNTLSRYLRVAKNLQDKGYSVAVLDIPPAVKQGNVYKMKHYGTRSQRARIVKAYNRLLRIECDKAGVPLVELYSYVADDNGFLKEEYAAPDDAHLTRDCVPFVTEQLEELFPWALCE